MSESDRDGDGDGDGVSGFAVELEPAPVVPRRHRWLTLPSGLVLFVCVFLPAVRGCDQPVRPYELPMLDTPYLLGLLVAVIALVRTPGALANLVLAGRVLVWVTVIGWALYLLAQVLGEGDALWPAFVVAGGGAGLITVVGGGRGDESAAARLAIGTALLGIVWFGMWCFTDDALYGVYVSAGASVAMLVGGLEWRREVARDARGRVTPAATVAR